MPDIGIAASSDDAIQQIGAAAVLTGGQLICDTDDPQANAGTFIGLRFLAVPIAKGSTVVAAQVKFFVGKGDDPRLDIYCHDIDSSPTFTTGVNDVSNRLWTTAKVDWDADNVGTSTYVASPNLAALIQEVTDRTGWVSGNPITVLIVGQSATSTFDFQAWDDAGTNHALLTIQSLSVNPSSPTVSFVANQPNTSAIPARPDSPTVAFVASNPTVVTGRNAPAESASVAFVAFDPGAQTTPEEAEGVFTAFDAQQMVEPVAGTAVVSFIANNPARGATPTTATMAFVANSPQAENISPTLGTAVVSFIAQAAIGATFIEPEAPFPLTTDRYRRTITETHTIKTVLDLHHLDMPEAFAQLGLVDGGITMERSADIPRSAELIVIDEENAMTAQSAETILEPLTKEVHIWNGIVYPDGTEELKSCGWYPIFKYELVRHGGKRQYRITLYDRGKRAQVDFGKPYSTIAGAPLGRAIRDLLTYKSPGLAVDIPELTEYEVPRLIFATSSNPLAEAVKLAKWAGFNLEANRGTGAIQLVPVKNFPDAHIQWEMVDNANACAWEVETSMDLDDAPNHVIVTGKGAGGMEISGEAMDRDPASPTWVMKVGKRTKSYEDERITSKAMAKRAAELILGRDLGTSKVHPLKALPNPAMELDDTVWLRQPDYGIDTHALVEKVEMPLTAKDYMGVTLRRGVLTDEDLIGSVLP